MRSIGQPVYQGIYNTQRNPYTYAHRYTFGRCDTVWPVNVRIKVSLPGSSLLFGPPPRLALEQGSIQPSPPVNTSPAQQLQPRHLCYVDDKASKVAWLNRSNIIFAGEDKWSLDPRVDLVTKGQLEYSLRIQKA
eukprot:superscaffoldBa00000015_g288